MIDEANDWMTRTIRSSEIDSAWELVKPGLDLVRARTKATWRAEHIYSELIAGRSELHLGYLKGQYIGGAVTSTWVDPFTNDKELGIWAMFSANPTTRSVGESGRLVLQFLEGLGRSQSYRRIVFFSPREGWLRRLRNQGFAVMFYKMAKEL